MDKLIVLKMLNSKLPYGQRKPFSLR
ncbi:hypothetical protein VS_II1469 [Vibrio atlanticus]|uniref:Uncharacterized protein n=1 Tax=Vibrio atlanticus (strain LGP32) TaxID=575788 RepID=B7VTZ7_VIBA3|nr:hypothetical protein VS_II1469 [Vibrio atlanticus]